MTDLQHQSTKPVPESDRKPLPVVVAVIAVVKCVLTTMRLLIRREIRQPSEHVGDELHFADGSFARVYRETTIPRNHVAGPTALVVEFRLRWIRGRGHAWFRAESLVNTPLFVGFPGFVSKLWLAHDQNGFYRGVYEWDGTELAHAYARALWWILALVCERTSIHYTVLRGRVRADLLAGEGVPVDGAPWWRVTAVTR